MIRGIIFDCFGVLYGGSLETFLRSLPEGQVRYLRDVNRSYDYGYIERSEYIAAFAEVLDKTNDEVAAIMRGSHVRNLELVDYVRQLRQTHYVGLLSNVGQDGLDKLFPPDELEELFHTAVLSYREGLVKPHPEIFALAAERLGCRPSECIMIDDLIENCEGAEVAGLQAVLHTTNKRTIQEVDALIHDGTRT